MYSAQLRAARAVLLIVVITFGPGSATASAQVSPPSPSSELVAQLDAVLADPSLDGVVVGAAVRSAETGQLVYSRASDKHMPAGLQPSSTVFRFSVFNLA